MTAAFIALLDREISGSIGNKGDTLNYILKQIANGSQAPYKVYTALLTQSGTEAPTAVELQNTLGEVTFEYNDVGNYSMIFADTTLDENKLWYLKNTKTGEEDEQKWLHISFVDENTIALNTSDGAGSNSNDYLLITSIEIRVYE